MLLAIALQAAAPAAGTTAPAPARFSILAGDCPTPAPGGDIVVCARPGDPERLPLPKERAPVGPLMVPGAAERMVDNRPRPAGPVPCGATMKGCTVGFGPPLALVAHGAMKLVRQVSAPRPDRSGRIAIPLDDPPATAAASAQDVHP